MQTPLYHIGALTSFFVQVRTRSPTAWRALAQLGLDREAVRHDQNRARVLDQAESTLRRILSIR